MTAFSFQKNLASFSRCNYFQHRAVNGSSAASGHGGRQITSAGEEIEPLKRVSSSKPGEASGAGRANEVEGGNKSSPSMSFETLQAWPCERLRPCNALRNFHEKKNAISNDDRRPSESKH